jgi:hypothetical protein
MLAQGLFLLTFSALGKSEKSYLIKKLIVKKYKNSHTIK